MNHWLHELICIVGTMRRWIISDHYFQSETYTNNLLLRFGCLPSVSPIDFLIISVYYLYSGSKDMIFFSSIQKKTQFTHFHRNLRYQRSSLYALAGNDIFQPNLSKIPFYSSPLDFLILEYSYYIKSHSYDFNNMMMCGWYFLPIPNRTICLPLLKFLESCTVSSTGNVFSL